MPPNLRHLADGRGDKLARGQRRRIGILVGDINEDYQAAIVHGAREAARERGIQLRSFVGGEIGSDKRLGPERNLIFGMVGPDNVDALIVMAGAIGNICGRTALASFCAQLGNLPMCTLSGELPGVVNIAPNNADGVREAIAHLVTTHGRRRIAFIQGPAGNQDAEERFRGYRDALAEHAIAMSTARVALGDFSSAAGEAAVKAFFDRPESDGRPDAIVAADDSTALGALRELSRRKIAVPSQVALIGFDDVEESRTSSPALTTIRQPLHEQGAEAIRVASALLDGEHPPLRITLPTRVVLRRSCGCSGAPGARDVTKRSFEAEVVARGDIVRAELRRVTRGALAAAPGWDDRLVASFVDQTRNGSETFARTVRALREQVATLGADPTTGDAVLDALRDQMLACLGNDAALGERVETVIREGRRVFRGRPSTRPKAR